jgi:hypothetical protein
MPMENPKNDQAEKIQGLGIRLRVEPKAVRFIELHPGAWDEAPKLIFQHSRRGEWFTDTYATLSRCQRSPPSLADLVGREEET